MTIREPSAALHHPAFGPINQLGVKLILITEGKVNAFLRLLPNNAETFFDAEPMPNALRDGATKAFAKKLFFIRHWKETHRRGKLAL